MRILLIEDEEKLAQSLMRGLSKRGYAVDHLTEGKPATERLSLYRNEYDLAILDLTLPDTDGFAVCKNVRDMGVTLPILVLTARSSVDDKVSLLRAGADDYMVKPFAFQELLARIQAIMRRPEEIVPDELTVGEFTLNKTTHRVFRDGTELILTLKEFMLLEYFMRHPNQVIKRDDVLDHAWEFDFSSLSNIVDVHVKNLRKKIGNDGNEIIKTVRGVGYQFMA
ncbi:response regulator transcription factor [Candidatus Parcubacteria bacterium]|uniref:DNA-binding response regulator n=1 Tax=Candidatus Kaiserbacteria bacterium CG10_big_fil_rev_8_21_14_0_10_47_16 TaxID=1974608 RepID=A0A2H0UGC7_9BACT|nr:response regulator transcription factor [Candidatus Parcubacteria bacterium]PIR84736.1 MAG: DNA-binding response regulator [Candidatus Kaiserbacteria bacterium CG10_big_fil_rev_8_21_14_0_10_47_16]